MPILPLPGRRCIQAALSGLLLLGLTGCAGGLGGGKERPPEWEKPIQDIDHKVEQTEKSSRAALADLQRRLAAQEAEMRLLRGNLEVVQHENQSLKEQVKEKAVMESEMDRPVAAVAPDQSIVMPNQPGQPAAVPPGGKAAMVSGQPATAQAVPVAPQQPPVAGRPPAPPAAVATPAAAPAATTTVAKVNPAPTAPVTAGTPQQMYDAALLLLKSGHYKEAREGFEKFQEKYPDDTLSDNAQYWIGELHMVQKQHREALLAFGKVISKWPTSTKVPDSLLKIGYAFQELGDLANARVSLTKLINDYPDAKATPMARQRLQEIVQKEKESGATVKAAPAATNTVPSKSEPAKAEPPGSRRVKRLAGE